MGLNLNNTLLSGMKMENGSSNILGGTKTMKYKLILAYDVATFEERVNKALSAGWVLHGNPTIVEKDAHYNGTTYCKDSVIYGQAVIQPEDSQ